LPRFNDDDYNPNRNANDNRDRTVPDDGYYFSTPDLNFNNRTRSSADKINKDELRPPVRYNQQGVNPVYYTDNDNNYQNRAKNNQPNKSKKPNGKNKSKRKKKNKAVATLVIILIIIIAIVAGIFSMLNGVLSKINYDDKVDNQYVQSSDLVSDSNVTNILLLGVDARANEESEQSRADSMMLLSIDKTHNCIKMVSFLRDTWVYIPCHDGYQRLNAACTYGGYNGVVDTIEYNFGIDIDGYVVADFQMFKVLVDSVGGVEIDVTEAEANEVTNHKKRYGNVTLEAGTHTLTGEQALAYCRIRKIDTDFKRTQRQRTVITSILTSMKSANPLSLYKVAGNAAEYIETDLSKNELMKVATSALSCIKGDMPQARVPFDGTWQYATIKGNSVISIDVDENKDKLVEYIYKMSAEEIAQAEEDK
jgi:LCP family protein required for cell wall assembly